MMTRCPECDETVDSNDLTNCPTCGAGDICFWCADACESYHEDLAAEENEEDE